MAECDPPADSDTDGLPSRRLSMAEGAWAGDLAAIGAGAPETLGGGTTGAVCPAAGVPGPRPRMDRRIPESDTSSAPGPTGGSGNAGFENPPAGGDEAGAIDGGPPTD